MLRCSPWAVLTLCLTISTFVRAQGYTTVKGVVQVNDSRHHRPHTDALVTVNKGSISTRTNADGTFVLNIPDDLNADTIFVVAPGYRGVKKNFLTEKSPVMLFTLMSSEDQQRKIITAQMDIRLMVEQAVKNMKRAYPGKANSMEAGIAASVVKNKQLTSLTQACLQINNNGYLSKKSTGAGLLWAKHCLDTNTSHFIYDEKVNPQQVINFISPAYEKPFLFKQFGAYDFKLERIIQGAGTLYYEIGFQPKPQVKFPTLYKGRFILDVSHQAFLSFDYSVEHTGDYSFSDQAYHFEKHQLRNLFGKESIQVWYRMLDNRYVISKISYKRHLTTVCTNKGYTNELLFSYDLIFTNLSLRSTIKIDKDVTLDLKKNISGQLPEYRDSLRAGFNGFFLDTRQRKALASLPNCVEPQIKLPAVIPKAKPEMPDTAISQMATLQDSTLMEPANELSTQTDTMAGHQPGLIAVDTTYLETTVPIEPQIQTLPAEVTETIKPAEQQVQPEPSNSLDEAAPGVHAVLTEPQLPAEPTVQPEPTQSPDEVATDTTPVLSERAFTAEQPVTTEQPESEILTVPSEQSIPTAPVEQPASKTLAEPELQVTPIESPVPQQTQDTVLPVEVPSVRPDTSAIRSQPVLPPIDTLQMKLDEVDDMIRQLDRFMDY